MKLGIIGVVNRSQLDITNKKVNSFLVSFNTCFHEKLKGSFCFTQLNFILNIKGAGSRNRKQTCYLCDLYCCPHVAIVFRSDFGGWGEFTIKLLQKSTNISAILQRMSVWFISLENSRVHLQNNTYNLRKVVENLCDMGYQKS